jgi:hypothetical protein
MIVSGQGHLDYEFIVEATEAAFAKPVFLKHYSANNWKKWPKTLLPLWKER